MEWKERSLYPSPLRNYTKIKILPGDEENMDDEEHLSSEEFEELGEVDPAFTNVE